MESLLWYIPVLWIANIFLCAWLAGEKNRSSFAWIVLSIFFGLLATLFIIGAPVNMETEEATHETPTD